jgi:hypothetical protein
MGTLLQNRKSFPAEIKECKTEKERTSFSLPRQIDDNVVEKEKDIKIFVL